MLYLLGQGPTYLGLIEFNAVAVDFTLDFMGFFLKKGYN